MSVPLIAPERELFPNRMRWTVAECHQLVKSGQIQGRYELIDGEILSKMGQKPLHSFVLVVIADWLRSLYGRGRVKEQAPIRIPGVDGCYTEPEPDVILALEPVSAYTSRHPGPDDLIIAIEAADTSLQFDLTTKALLYARAGVPEYWVADIPGRQIHIHRRPAEDGYRLVLRAGIGETVALESRPNDLVEVSTFFPAEDTETADGS